MLRLKQECMTVNTNMIPLEIQCNFFIYLKYCTEQVYGLVVSLGHPYLISECVGLSSSSSFQLTANVYSGKLHSCFQFQPGPVLAIADI